MADLRIFVECTTAAVFESHLNAGDITNNQIVFIKSTNQLYHNGVYYGISADDAAKLAEVYARKEFGKISDGTEVEGSLVTYSATKAEDTLVIKASSTSGEVMNVTAGSGGFTVSLIAATGATNGTISLNGTEVAVYGLGSAAFEDTTAFDAAGDADAAETAAKSYADAITVNGQSQTNQAITVDGGDIDLTGYAKASSKAAVAATDSVNVGIGKLEYRLDNLDLGDATTTSKEAFLNNTALTGVPTAPTAAVNTNTTQIATTAFVKNEIDDRIVAIQAMQFKGVADSASDLAANAQPGWTYRAGTAFTLGSEEVEVGDMIICTAAATTDPVAAATWAVIQNNIDGAVVGPASAVSGNVALFDGTTGKVIADSGKTLGVSVPEDANFDNTTYEFKAGTNGSFTVTPTVHGADAEQYTAAQAATYNAALPGAIASGTSLTEETAALVNAALSLTGDDAYDAGDEISADDAVSYAATLPGAVAEGDDKKGTPQTVSIGKPATAGTADQVGHTLTVTKGDGTTATFNGSADAAVSILSNDIKVGTTGHAYSKPQTVTAISDSDSIQAAIGKLEAMFDWVVYNAVVPEP